MTRIVQIIPYFGKWPKWIDLYVYSCLRNPMVDFLFFTDCGRPGVLSGKSDTNVIIKEISFDDYKRLVSRRLDIAYNPQSPYKLTDLKPFLGLIHEDEIRDYDWWGFGDIDLVYGDLSILINDRSLETNDLLTTHDYHIAGHCTFMRNNDYYCRLCLGIKDWRKRLGDETHYGFDEAEWSNLVYPSIKYPLAIYRKLLRKLAPKSFHSFMSMANRLLCPRERFREYFTSPAPKPGEQWLYCPGTGSVVSPTGSELPYIHFLFFKKTPWFETDNYWRDGFYGLTEEIQRYKRIIIDIDGIRGV